LQSSSWAVTAKTKGWPGYSNHAAACPLHPMGYRIQMGAHRDQRQRRLLRSWRWRLAGTVCGANMRRGKIYALHCGRRALVDVVPDSHTGLYRISWPDIGLSDVTNLMRAKAAALEWAEQKVVTEGRKMPVAQRL